MSHDEDSEARVTPEVVEVVEVAEVKSLAVPEAAAEVVAKLPEAAGELTKSPAEKEAGAATEIAYCPHLGIYHYRRADGDEFLFEELGLERAIESYLKQADTRQAEFMAALTAFARKFPHQVVSFDGDGNLNLRELLAREHLGEEEPGDAGESEKK